MTNSNDVAIVTGATSGIGRATAVALAVDGFEVVVSGRNQAEARVTAEAVRSAGGTAHTFLGDVADSSVADALVASAGEAGRLRVLVNGAGIIVRADAVGTSDDDWRRQMAVNVDSVFFVSRAAVPYLREAGGGSIINVSSTCGLVGSAGLAGYCATKGAVISLTQAMALDHAGENIRVNAVCPGAIDTPMLRSGRDTAPMADAEILAANVASIPQGRVPGPEEVADVVAFLASEASRHVTGVALPIDGGYTAQ